jgi:predicted outer membrane repeat protein
LQVEYTLFQDSRSLGRGGAISAVGAILNVTATRFINCSSLGNGGGAIIGTNFICYGSTQEFNTEVNIVGSSFEGCSSKGSGGAVTIASSLASMLINASLFIACNSAREGGAVSLIGGSAKVVDSVFIYNRASGLGGGALYSENAQLVLHGVSAHGNTAEAGGGGVLYWLGQLPPIVTSWCKQGTFPDPDSVCNPLSCSPSCLPCQKGTYLNSSGVESQRSCQPCEAGTYSSMFGASYCLSCSSGFYSTTIGAIHPSVCGACEPGSYVDMRAATACLFCEAGYYSSEFGLSACLHCPAGTYQTSSGEFQQDACVECPGGSYSPNVGSAYCSQCDAGYYSGQMALSCTSCPAGKFSSVQSSTECKLCGPGQFSDQGADICSLCWAGTFSTGLGMNSSVSCSECGDGLFSGRGAARCIQIDGFRAGTALDVFSNGIIKYTVISLPFPFHFYGKQYWNVTLSTYGYLSMGECVLDYNNQHLFAPHLLCSIIAIFWQNLAAPVGPKFIQWFGNDTVTFQWTSWSPVSVFGQDGLLIFQVSLMRNGSFLLSYIELDGSDSSGSAATVGFQGEDLGETISYFSSGLHSGLCYLVSPDLTQSAQYSVEEYMCSESIRLVPTCESGKILGADYQCVLCPPGTFQTGDGMLDMNNCSLCAPGKFSHSSGATAAADCVQCASDSSNNSSGVGGSSSRKTAIFSDDDSKNEQHVKHTGPFDFKKKKNISLPRHVSSHFYMPMEKS